MEMYEVGGCVRDEILGVDSKDIDFSVVLTQREVESRWPDGTWMSDKDPFETMENILRSRGFELFEQARKPEFLTARGKFPKGHPVYSNMAADFVLARKEGAYTDGRRPDKVEVGTLYDDLARRDFTMNAIAKAPDGSYIDPFNGRDAIAERFIYAVGNAQERLAEDALRAVRALRFSVTKRFFISPAVEAAMESDSVLADIAGTRISDERIKDELVKMFRFDTLSSLSALAKYRSLTEAMFAGTVSLDATMKTKGRGKK